SHGWGSGVGAEGGVERRGRWVEQLGGDELAGLAGAVQPLHPGVLPLHRDGPLVADGVQYPKALLPRHVAVPGGDEVPATTRIRPRQVRAQSAVTPVA